MITQTQRNEILAAGFELLIDEPDETLFGKRDTSDAAWAEARKLAALIPGAVATDGGEDDYVCIEILG